MTTRLSHFWLALTAVDAFVFGGLVAVLLIRRLLITIMLRLASPSAQAELLNVLDHVLPYTLGYAAAAVLLALVTVAVWLSTRPRPGRPAGLVVLMPLVLGALLLTGRELAAAGQSLVSLFISSAVP